MPTTPRFQIFLLLLILAMPITAQQSMDSATSGEANCAWQEGYSYPGLNGEVLASTVYDDGTGPALYVGGQIKSADGIPAKIAKWDGVSWSVIDSAGLPGSTILALAAFDDGTGTTLYAASGYHQNDSVFRWDGDTWSAVGSGLTGRGQALIVYDDGGGDALYAGGTFGVRKWDGTSWTLLGNSNASGTVNAFAVYDDGTGPALFIGGDFTSAGGNSANRIVKWDGTTWSNLGSGVNNIVYALATYNDGGGDALYVGGDFTATGGGSANRIAKWDGTLWSSLGNTSVNGSIKALTSHNDGNGLKLYVGGWFTNFNGIGAADFIVQWDGASWGVFDSGLEGGVMNFTEYDDGGGTRLYVGGYFTTSEGTRLDYLASWDGLLWSKVTNDDGKGLQDMASAFAIYDDGTGPALYAGGRFLGAGDVPISYLAKWNGSTWSSVGGGTGGSVTSLAVYDDGNGPALYVSGDFTTVGGGIPASRIAKWDGTEWTPLGTGLNLTATVLTTHDDGTGPALYAGGRFSVAGGVNARRVAKWDGFAWSALGNGFGNNEVNGLVSYGGDLYIGGLFHGYISKWDGTQWSALGSGLDSAVKDLTIYDDGSGSALFVGGFFSTAGGVTSPQIAKWDGTTWSAVSSGFSSGRLKKLVVLDDESGKKLMVVGTNLRPTGGAVLGNIATWDGSEWGSLNSDLEDVDGVFATGGPEGLFFGGGFQSVDGVISSSIAQYVCKTPPHLEMPDLIVSAAEPIPIPILLLDGNHELISTTFSIDYDEACLDPDSNGDGILDLIQTDLPPDFTVSALLDTGDSDGEIDVSLTDEIAPFTALPTGDLLSIDFEVVCSGSAVSPIEIPVSFSLDPQPSFMDDASQLVSGIWSDGNLVIWPGVRGDCDDSGILDSDDLTALAREIFDDDSEFWTNAPGSTFAGSPTGCDANASSRIRAADAACTAVLTSAGACATPEGATTPPLLVLSTELEDGVIWIQIALAANGADVGSFAISFDLDPTIFDPVDIDGNGDGIPDRLRFPQGDLEFVDITLDAADNDGELDLLLVNSPQQAFPVGVLVEIGMTANEVPHGGIVVSMQPWMTFGSPEGGDLEGGTRFLPIFADGFETADLGTWSSIVVTP